MKYKMHFSFLGCWLPIVSLFLQPTAFEFPTVNQLHAHNDYQKAVPFWNAWKAGCGFIEVDVYYSEGQVFVAHDTSELKRAAKFETDYLQPILQVLSRQSGRIYLDTTARLGLVIDIKNETEQVVSWLKEIIASYPAVFEPSTGVYIVLSGQRPSPATWAALPDCVFIDGRLEDQLDEQQRNKIAMISAPFGLIARWNGLGILRPEAEAVLDAMVNKANQLNSPLRLWGAPDTKTAWQYLTRKGVAILNTDKVEEASHFVRSYSQFFYYNKQTQEAYQAAYPPFSEAPKQVIMIIGDGTGLGQLYAAYTANRQSLSIFSIRQLGFLHTYSSDSYCTDSAAGATAYSSGVKTNNRHLGCDPQGKPLLSITDLLGQSGFSTAILSSVNITDATPAAFYAQVNERDKLASIAEDLSKAQQDLIVGEGLDLLEALPDLETQLKETGRQLADTLKLTVDTAKLLQLFPQNHFAVGQKALPDRSRLANKLEESLDYLSSLQKPFFLVAESGSVDRGGHENNMGTTVNEVLSLDLAVGKALAFVDAHPETLLIVLADHETGGLTLLDGNFEEQWVLGSYSTNDHTGLPIPYFVYGAGAAAFQGIMDNTAIFHTLKRLLLP